MFRSLLFIFISIFILTGCGGGTSSSSTVKGVAQLGYISGGTVNLYEKKDLSKLVSSTTTSKSTDISEAGSFTFENIEYDENEYYILEVIGGYDIDSNDDGIIDTSTQVELKGRFYTIVSGNDLTNNSIRVTALSDMAYLKIKDNLQNLSNNEIQKKLNEFSNEYLYDLNEDNIINYKDLNQFNPTSHRSKTKKSYNNILNVYVPKLHNGDTEFSKLSSLLYLDEPVIKIENGNIQEIPFNLNASVENLPEGLAVKWFLDNEEISSLENLKIEKEGNYNLVTKFFFKEKNISYLSTDLVAINPILITSFEAKADETKTSYIFREDSEKLKGISINVPSGALEKNTIIEIKETNLTNIPNLDNPSISSVLTLEPSGLQLNKPILINMPYITNTDIEDIIVARYSKGGVIDFIEPYSIDEENKIVTFKTEHFTSFVLQSKLFSGNKPLTEQSEIQDIAELFDIDVNKYTNDEWFQILNEPQSDDLDLTVYDMYLDYKKLNDMSEKLKNDKYTEAMKIILPNSKSALELNIKKIESVENTMKYVDSFLGFSPAKMLSGILSRVDIATNIVETTASLLGLPSSVNDVADVNTYIPNHIDKMSTLYVKMDDIFYKSLWQEFDNILYYSGISDESDFMNYDVSKNSVLNNFMTDSVKDGVILKALVTKEMIHNLKIIYLQQKHFLENKEILKHNIKTTIHTFYNSENKIIHVEPKNHKSYTINTEYIPNFRLKPSGYGRNGFLSYNPKITFYYMGNKLVEFDEFKENKYDLGTFYLPEYSNKLKAFNMPDNYILDWKYEDDSGTVRDGKFYVKYISPVKVELDSYKIYDYEIETGKLLILPTFKKEDNSYIEYEKTIMIGSEKQAITNGYIYISDYKNTLKGLNGEEKLDELKNVRIIFEPKLNGHYTFDSKKFKIDLVDYSQNELNNSFNYVDIKYNGIYNYADNSKASINIYAENYATKYIYPIGIDYENDGILDTKVSENNYGEIFANFEIYESTTLKTCIRYKHKDFNIEKNICTENEVIEIDDNPTSNTSPISNSQLISLNQDTTKSIILSAIDVDEDELTYIIVSQPSNGTLSGTAPNLTYTPNSGYSGSDSFSFKVNDGKADSNISTISITIDKVINKQITFVSESIPNDGSVVLRGSSFVKSWTFKNSGNVDLSNLKVETVNAPSGLTATINQNVSSSLKQNATTTYALNISVPSDLQEGTYEAKYKLTDSSVDLKYSNGGISYFTYKLSVPKPNDFKAYAYLSSSTYSTDENTLLSVVVNDGNKPYQISINWGDGTSLTSAQITNVSEVKNFTYKYSSEGNYVVTTNITDSMGKTAQVKNSVTIKNSVDSTTKWSVSGADLITNTNQENLDVQITNASTHSVYTTSWMPQSTSDDYWITYKLPIPKDLIKMTNKLRVTFVGKAGELEDYDRSITLALSDGKNYSYNFMTNINNGSGFIRIKDYQGSDTKQLVSSLTDSSVLVRQNDRAYAIENNYLGTSSNSTLEAYKFENSNYTSLASTSKSITASNNLKELQINLKGNGTITLLKLEYDKNGDKNYSSDETMILNTDNLIVDWSSFINTGIEIPEQPINTITHNGFTYKTVSSPTTGRVWLDRNIGASRVCTSATDELCFGDYFQWGRNADGHEKLNSNISTVQATNISNVGDGNFIQLSYYDNVEYDWAYGLDSSGELRETQWNKIDGTSICPVGFRVPNKDELNDETYTTIIQSKTNLELFSGFLKLPSAGQRSSLNSEYLNKNDTVYLWTSSANPNGQSNYKSYDINGSMSTYSSSYRTSGYSVRCIQDDSDNIVAENISNTVYSNSLRTPNGGEEWNNGEIQTIQWSKLYINSNFVDLYVLNDNADGLLDKSRDTLGNVVNTKKWYKFASKIENNGSYELDPALLNGSGNSYMILVVASDDKTKWDISDGTFSLNESVDSSTENLIGHNGFVYNTIKSSKTGRVWLDRNIGATKVCNSDISDFESYEMYMIDQIDCFGNYYQAKDNNGNLNITNWRKTDGTSICPVGFRVPDAEEFFEEITTSSNAVYTGDISGSHSSFDTNSSFLNLPFSGYKNKDGNIVRSEESLDLFNSNQVSIGSFWTTGQSLNSLYSDKYYSMHYFSDLKVQPRLLMNLENSFNIRCINDNVVSIIK